MRQRPKRLLDQVRDAVRRKHYSSRTEGSYVHWIKRYTLFHKKGRPERRWGAPRWRPRRLPTVLTKEDAGGGQAVVRDANGLKDRVTVLTGTLAVPLQTHLEGVRTMHA